MRKLVLRWILLAFSVVVASYVSQALGLKFAVDVSTFASTVKLFIGVAVLSFLNATVGRLLKFLTLPLSCITLGLFSLVVNAAILWFAASFELGFKIKGTGTEAFLAAFVAAVLISFINGVLGVFLPDDKDE
ncbi:MAG: phage holin family protein [Fimbriimonas ginsengisoli]|uniref:Phage holin family protein n=1 Tax=Fimbriimonas ginsengisoli TaxID=1005039 RepID=A0A931LX55_FIMGI|nr:phage holin family protein [Fimbriimonas ginsengisoli]